MLGRTRELCQKIRSEIGFFLIYSSQQETRKLCFEHTQNIFNEYQVCEIHYANK